MDNCLRQWHVLQVAHGQRFMISVVADGAEPLQYSWTYNGAPLPGQTRPELAVPNALKASHQGLYKAKVRRMACSENQCTLSAVGTLFTEYSALMDIMDSVRRSRHQRPMASAPQAADISFSSPSRTN